MAYGTQRRDDDGPWMNWTISETKEGYEELLDKLKPQVEMLFRSHHLVNLVMTQEDGTVTEFRMIPDGT